MHIYVYIINVYKEYALFTLMHLHVHAAPLYFLLGFRNFFKEVQCLKWDSIENKTLDFQVLKITKPSPLFKSLQKKSCFLNTLI